MFQPITDRLLAGRNFGYDSIRDDAIIGANAIVTKDIPASRKVVGTKGILG